MVSIIMPVYKVSAYIEDCVLSVLRQTYKNWELIIVDDCGEDDSIEKINRLLCEHRQLEKGEVMYTILRHKKNRGLSAARNTGLEVAKGDYVYFLDSDDKIFPNCLELLVSKAEKSGADVTIGDIEIKGYGTWIPRLNIQDSIYMSHDNVLVGHENVLLSYLRGEYYVMAWNKLIKKNFLLDNHILFVEGLIHEDNPWSLSIACAARKVAIVIEKTYIYLVRENSLQTEKSFERHYNAYCKILELLEQTILSILPGLPPNIQEDLCVWYERQKAIFFHETITKGGNSRALMMYKIIHRMWPQKHFSKSHIHYCLPSVLGYLFYKRFYRYNLC